MEFLYAVDKLLPPILRVGKTYIEAEPELQTRSACSFSQYRSSSFKDMTAIHIMAKRLRRPEWIY